jgi:hypothetical protein
MKLRLLFVAVVLSLAAAFPGTAFAWPACSGQWVSVPKGTTGGTLYNTGDLLFQCQPKSTPPPTTPSTSNSNSSANSASTSAANSSSNSSSKSTSSATQNQGQTQGQQQGQVANGGRASSTAQGGTATAQNSDSGNSSNDYSSTTQVDASKIPVSTAYAPSVFPTVTCFKGFGAGVQTMPVGASFGGGKIDENCAILEAAGRARNLLTFCKVYITNKYVKKSGTTLENCMSEPPVPVAQVVTPVVVPVTPAPAPVIGHEIVTMTAPVESTLEVIRNGEVNNVAKAQLDGVVLYAKQANGGHLILRADSLTGVYRIQRVLTYLSANGIYTGRVTTELKRDFGKDVVVIYSLN